MPKPNYSKAKTVFYEFAPGQAKEATESENLSFQSINDFLELRYSDGRVVKVPHSRIYSIHYKI